MARYRVLAPNGKSVNLFIKNSMIEFKHGTIIELDDEIGKNFSTILQKLKDNKNKTKNKDKNKEDKDKIDNKEDKENKDNKKEDKKENKEENVEKKNFNTAQQNKNK